MSARGDSVSYRRQLPKAEVADYHPTRKSPAAYCLPFDTDFPSTSNFVSRDPDDAKQLNGSPLCHTYYFGMRRDRCVVRDHDTGREFQLRCSDQSGAGRRASGTSIGIAFAGNDPTQTFTWGSQFTVKFNAVSKLADTLDWWIADYAGKVHASGAISVVEGTTTANMVCSSTISGYFAVSAS